MLGLRLFVTDLEKTKDLYVIVLKASSHKDSLILMKDLYILNRDSVIIEHTKFIEFQRKENNRLEALNKEIEKAYLEYLVAGLQHLLARKIVCCHSSQCLFTY